MIVNKLRNYQNSGHSGKFRKNISSGTLPEIPDITVRNLTEVPTKGVNNNCARFQNDWSGSPEKQSTKCPLDHFIAQNTWTGDRVKLPAVATDSRLGDIR